MSTRIASVGVISVLVGTLLVGCGSDAAMVSQASVGATQPAESSTSEPAVSELTNDFADQLIIDHTGWFQTLGRSATDCFALGALSQLEDTRLEQLGFTSGDLPLLFEADWTNAEIGYFVDVLDRCVGANTSLAAEAFLASLNPQFGHEATCLVPKVVSTFGADHHLEWFRSSFNPPRVEARNGDETGRKMMALFTELEPLLEECGFATGPPGDADSAESACGDDACEDSPEDLALESASLVLACSRDPYHPADIYIESHEGTGGEPVTSILGELDDRCEGRGHLVSVVFLDYPCPTVPVDVTLTAAELSLTALDEACLQSDTTTTAQTTKLPHTTEDLEQVDWEALTYDVPSCDPDHPTWELVMVEQLVPQASGHAFVSRVEDLTFGSMGPDARPIAAAHISLIGAGSFPGLVLLYGEGGPQPELLAIVAGPGDCHVLDSTAHPWEVISIEFTDGRTLLMTGRGWDRGAHCCPDLDVTVEIELDHEGVFAEIEHTEVPTP